MNLQKGDQTERYTTPHTARVSVLHESASTTIVLAKRYVERSLAYSRLNSYSIGYFLDGPAGGLAKLGKTILGLAGAADHSCNSGPGRYLV